jgi:hypothetical protein
MAALNVYREAIEQVFSAWRDFLARDENVHMEMVMDRERDRYLLVEVGWENGYRVYAPLLHVDIIDDELWIQHDGTERGIAGELVAAGVAKDRIVLAFRPENQQGRTEFALT